MSDTVIRNFYFDILSAHMKTKSNSQGNPMIDAVKEVVAHSMCQATQHFLFVAYSLHISLSSPDPARSHSSQYATLQVL